MTRYRVRTRLHIGQFYLILSKPLLRERFEWLYDVGFRLLGGRLHGYIWYRLWLDWLLCPGPALLTIPITREQAEELNPGFWDWYDEYRNALVYWGEPDSENESND